MIRGLVARRLRDQHLTVRFETMGQRVWFALQCLPRDSWGKPPEIAPLERSHGLAKAQLQKLLWDMSPRPTYETMQKVATALDTSPDWLLYERGEGPRARWPVQPRPEGNEQPAYVQEFHRKKRTRTDPAKRVKGSTSG